ncbi:MAG TPA: tetrahydrofolate dehydrogenase/cyclohydrolase catalytic domain-containing protein, partial [Stenomitos sp.]
MPQTSARIIDGKALSLEIEEEVRQEVAQLTSAGKTPPCLVVVVVGEDPASQVYVRNKGRACERVGFG